MKRKTLKFLALLLSAMMILGFATVAFPAHGQPEAKLFVEPQNNIFNTSVKTVGDTIVINVTVANITGLFGVEFKLSWDPTLLKGVSMQEVLYSTLTPPGEEGNIWPLKHIVADDYIWYSYTYMDASRAISEGYAPFNITVEDGFPQGKMTIATITLEIIKAPTMVEEYVECNLHIYDDILGDLNLNNIPHETIDGYYKLSWAPPTVYPYFSVEPSSYEATELYEVFNISIKINNLDEGWEAVGFEFKLRFNTTLLDVVDVTEGPFLPPFGSPPNQGTLFMTHIGEDYIQVGDVVLADENGTWHSPFPHGEGVIAIITFKATYQGIFPEVAGCALELYDTMVANWLGEEVPQASPVSGTYTIRPKTLGRAIDIYTQWPDPYGGQGPNKPSDMFWPQQEVILYAYVSYNEWPEQNKHVTFEVKAPHGDTFTVLDAWTNASGIAVASFRLPWPCDDPEYYFGEWSVIGTVDIAGEVVNDTLTFHYDYLVYISKVTTDLPKYEHGQTMNITVELKSKRMQSMDIIIAVTVQDATGVPFGFTYFTVTIGGAEYCHYKDFSDSVGIFVEKWARAGRASITVVALSDWPFNGGSGISGPFSPVPVDIEAK